MEIAPPSQFYYVILEKPGRKLMRLNLFTKNLNFIMLISKGKRIHKRKDQRIHDYLPNCCRYHIRVL